MHAVIAIVLISTGLVVIGTIIYAIVSYIDAKFEKDYQKAKDEATDQVILNTLLDR